jgi:hypothetical protein
MRSKTDAEIRVAQKAAELAERAVRGMPPFDRFSNHLPLIRDKAYADKYSEEAKHELLGAYIASAKFNVGGDAFRNDEAYRRIMQFEKPIAENLRRDFVPISAEHRLKRRSFATKERRKLVEARVGQMLPDYRPDKKLVPATIPGAVIFSKPLLETNKTFVAFDVGVGKTDGIFESYIGVEKPFYSVRPLSFLGSIIRGVYYTPQELHAIVEETLDVLKLLLPLFGEKMEEALRGVDLSGVPTAASYLGQPC